MTMLSSPLSSRNQLAGYLPKMGLDKTAVEVGTHRGDFAEIFLKDWPGKYVGVDPWTVPPGYEYQATLLWGGGTREDDYRAAERAIHPYKDRARLLRLTSEAASHKFDDGSLDFVYVDGNHETPHPFDDCVLWWPKLRTGGVLAGHDFVCPNEPDGWGKYIQPAVLRFCEAYSVNVYLIVEEGGLPWSWYMFKG